MVCFRWDYYEVLKAKRVQLKQREDNRFTGYQDSAFVSLHTVFTNDDQVSRYELQETHTCTVLVYVTTCSP